MTIAAILLCTTLVTNVDNTSVVTRECREVLPPIAMNAPTENMSTVYMQPALEMMNGSKTDLWSKKPETQVLAARSVSLQAMLPPEETVEPTVAPAPAIVKSVKPKRLKAAKQSQNRKLRKAPRRAAEIRDANRIQRPAAQQPKPKKLTAWEKLKGILIARPDLAPSS